VGDTLTRIGARLSELRVSAGLSQTEVGQPFFTRAHVSAIETGRMAPALKTLRHFAQRLRVPMRELSPPDL
jgi:transcriptional regulator with XRE-family HTH domain